MCDFQASAGSMSKRASRMQTSGSYNGTDIESGPFFGKNLGWQTE